MVARAPLVRVFVALVLAGAMPAQAVSLDDRLADVERRLSSTRAAAAEQAFQKGLLRDGAMLSRAVVERDPEHALGRRLAEVKAMSGADYVRTCKEAVKKHGKAFQKQLEKQLQPFAVELCALAEQALGAGDTERSEALFARAYAVDPDNASAKKALAKLDYDAIFNYGVLPKADKRAARATLKKLSGRFLERSDLQREREYWSDAWGLETRHYRFVTNAPHTTVFAFAEACERLHDAWDDFMSKHDQPLRKWSKPLDVFLFGSAVDYENVVRLAGSEPPDSDDFLGYYDPANRTGHFYYDEAFYAGDMTLLLETFFHEGAHQLLDLRFKAAWRGRAGDSPLCWVEEGYCVYLESLITSDDGRTHTFGTVVDDDLASAIDAIAVGGLMPMADFAHVAEDGWEQYEHAYAHAALVAHWLMHGDGGKRRDLLFDLLTAERQHGGLRKGTFAELVGMDYAAIDAALREHSATIGRDLARRVYAEPKDEGGR